MKKIICLLLVLILNIAGCSYLKTDNLHNNDSNNDTQIEYNNNDIQSNSEEEIEQNRDLNDVELIDIEIDIAELSDNDFYITDNIDIIMLGAKHSDFVTQKEEISNSYVGEKRSENNIIYKYYQHSYDDFDLYTSNINYDIKNRNFDEYYISQLTIKTANVKTARGIIIGDSNDDVLERYGLSKINSDDNSSLTYQLDEKNLTFMFNANNEVKSIRLSITVIDDKAQINENIQDSQDNVMDNEKLNGFNESSIYEIVSTTEVNPDIVLLGENDYIERYYYSPNHENIIVEKLIDYYHSHERVFYYNSEEVWAYDYPYLRLPYHNNLLATPIWLNNNEVLFNGVLNGLYIKEYILDITGNSSDIFKTDANILDINDIRGYSFNKERNNLILNTEDGLQLYNTNEDELQFLHQTHFSDTINEFKYTTDLGINGEIYIAGLKQNCMWGLDNNIYFTDSFLIFNETLNKDEHVNRIDMFNYTTKEITPIINNGYILNESPCKRYMTINDEQENKTIVWDMLNCQKFEIPLSQELSWSKNGLLLVYFIKQSSNMLYIEELTDAGRIINTVNISNYLSHDQIVSNLKFDVDGNITFDILTFKEDTYHDDLLELVFSYKIILE